MKSGAEFRRWPKSREFAERYLVRDLIPEDVRPKDFIAVFVGESPHRDEVAPESADERSPFRGVAGRDWWQELAKYVKKPIQARPVPPRPVLLHMCSELKIAIMNAVQFPIDPKIMLHQGEKSSPRNQLGFEKGAGEFSYKKVFKNEKGTGSVHHAINDLVARLLTFSCSSAQLVCLGNDSRWFVERAIQEMPADLPLLQKPLITLPHPASWWRNAANRTKAEQGLQVLLSRLKSRR